VTDETPSSEDRDLAPKQVPFPLLVALYLVPALLLLFVLIIAAWRQGDASAFRYVGF